MRLLCITPTFPYPLTNGVLRHYHLIKELSRQHAITLLSVVDRGFDMAYVAAMAPFTERVLTFPSTNKSRLIHQKVAHRLRRLRGPAPPVARLCLAATELIRRESFDAVFMAAGEIVAAARYVGDLPIVIDQCDATSMYLRGSIAYAPYLRLPFVLWDYLHVRRVEREMLRAADHLIYATRRDQTAILGDSMRPATIIPNGVDVTYWHRRSPARGTLAIVFTGVMNYPPNTDAAMLLIETVMPQVWHAVRDAELWIVGRDPPSRLVHAGRRPGVTVTGLVDDIRPYLEQATVFAAPIRFGAGIQNKLLEALAMEVPVITSPTAADGLRTAADKDPPVTIARRPEEFAAHLVETLKAPDRQPDATLREFVARHFVWEQSGAKLDAVLRAVGRRNTVPAV
jgi:glycosyltransferase involved in cell wall biosynthesis